MTAESSQPIREVRYLGLPVPLWRARWNIYTRARAQLVRYCRFDPLLLICIAKYSRNIQTRRLTVRANKIQGCTVCPEYGALGINLESVFRVWIQRPVRRNAHTHNPGTKTLLNRCRRKSEKFPYRKQRHPQRRPHPHPAPRNQRFVFFNSPLTDLYSL